MMSFEVIIAFAAALWASTAAAQTATRSEGPASSGINIGDPAVRPGESLNFEGTNGKTVIGKPLSATEERRTVQILADGTRIENTETARFYRDDEGRTRIQQMDGSAVIHDPKQGIPDQVSPDGRVRRILPFRYDSPPPKPLSRVELPRRDRLFPFMKRISVPNR
jgi:hypothetical protein